MGDGQGYDGQLGGGTPPPFNVWYRANTGSAKNTPKSDMEMLARIQHLASLNWASHRMFLSTQAGPTQTSIILVPSLHPTNGAGIGRGAWTKPQPTSLLMFERQMGALVEAGECLGAGKRLYLVTPHAWSFQHHPRAPAMNTEGPALARPQSRQVSRREHSPQPTPRETRRSFAHGKTFYENFLHDRQEGVRQDSVSPRGMVLHPGQPGVRYTSSVTSAVDERNQGHRTARRV